MISHVILGDCIETLRGLPDGCIDSLVSDPPYGLSKEPDAAEVIRHWCAESLREHVTSILGPRAAELAALLFPSSDYDHGARGFMGKSWDSFVPGPAVWREVLRVMKPGAHAVVFSGTRTYDLTVLAMRIAGFEIRDQLAWMYGTGFPKSLDVSKAIDAAAGAERAVVGSVERPAFSNGRGHGRDENGPIYRGVNGGHLGQTTIDITAPATDAAQQWAGWGTALKPAQEPIVLARKPFPKGATVAANVLAHGTGGINVDACRIGWASEADREHGRPASFSKARESFATESSAGTFTMRDRSSEDPIAVQSAAGRWPANVLLDEAAAAMLDVQSGISKSPAGLVTQGGDHFSIGSEARTRGTKVQGKGDTGGASRFFYVAKASRAEREAGLDHLPVRSGGELTDRVDGSQGLNSPRAGPGRKGGRRNHHPTVKPIELMRYLVRLVTPPGGFVLDPFAGSGTTGIAAALEGARFLGCELDPEFVTIAQARIAHWAQTGRAA